MSIRGSRWIPLLLAATIIALGTSDSAFAHARRSSYCAPSGDWCQSVKRIDGVRTLHFGTFEQRGRIDVCVRAPGDHHDCTHSRLRRFGRGFYVSKVNWRARFPFYGKGWYSVRWYDRNGYRMGVVLGFRVR
jgi:hypothetical protein